MSSKKRKKGSERSRRARKRMGKCDLMTKRIEGERGEETRKIGIGDQEAGGKVFNYY